MDFSTYYYFPIKNKKIITKLNQSSYIKHFYHLAKEQTKKLIKEQTTFTRENIFLRKGPIYLQGGYTRDQIQIKTYLFSP